MESLTLRLKTVAGFVRNGHKLIDVGTDHGYIPAYLITKGVIPCATACDIGKMPLLNAKKTAEKYGIEDKMRLTLSDGLKKIDSTDGDDVVIAGMGGELIRDILKDCEWIKNERIRLILQPMTHAEDVRRFLYENGFYILEEKGVKDAGKYYCVIVSEYEPGHKADEFDIIFGFSDGSQEYNQVRLRQKKKLCDKMKGAQISGDREKYDYCRSLLEEYEKRG